ncbi:hypothetical protein AHF37_04652 [Paragonimus kellicotti]|nr:hypothetical protein AHF37_04652 [Paragonimus kellicotti]
MARFRSESCLDSVALIMFCRAFFGGSLFILFSILPNVPSEKSYQRLILFCSVYVTIYDLLATVTTWQVLIVSTSCSVHIHYSLFLTVLSFFYRWFGCSVVVNPFGSPKLLQLWLIAKPAVRNVFSNFRLPLNF